MLFVSIYDFLKELCKYVYLCVLCACVFTFMWCPCFVYSLCVCVCWICFVLHTVSDAQDFKDGKIHYRFTADDGHDGGDKKTQSRPEFSRFQLLVSSTFTVRITSLGGGTAKRWLLVARRRDVYEFLTARVM